MTASWSWRRDGSDRKPTIDAIETFLDGVEAGWVDVDVIETSVHPDVEFTSAIGSEVEGRTYKGVAGVQEWFSELIDTFEARYEDRRYEEFEGGVVLVLARNVLRGKGSGAEVTQDIGIVYEVADGRISRVISYTSQPEARAAAERVAANA